MDVAYMRERIASLYSGKNWKDRCLYQMGDKQVIAIYFSMKEKGRFDRKPKVEPLYPEQISMWDVYADVMRGALNG